MPNRPPGSAFAAMAHSARIVVTESLWYRFPLPAALQVAVPGAAAQRSVLRQHLLNQERGALGHAPCAAAWAEAAALAAEGDELLGVAALAAHPQKAIFESAALEVLLELALHVARQRSLFGRALGEKAG